MVIIGTRWVHVGGRLKQIEAGPGGAVWGVNTANHIYFRAGVSRGRPIGRYWVRIGGSLKHVSVGCVGVYGINKRGQIWRYAGRRGVRLLRCHGVGMYGVVCVISTNIKSC